MAIFALESREGMVGAGRDVEEAAAHEYGRHHEQELRLQVADGVDDQFFLLRSFYASAPIS